MGKISFIGMVFGLLFLSLSNVFAATIHVPADQPTIQAGINAAANGDTVLVADGTYIGEGNHDIDFHGKLVVLRSEHGPDLTVIDCQADSEDRHRAFVIVTGEDSSLVINGFQIKNGVAPHYNDPYGQTYGYVGGGLLCFRSAPKIIDCHFRDNAAGNGAGLYVIDASPKIINCDFNNNIGEGIYFYGESNVSMDSCLCENNSGSGLAIEYDISVNVSHSTFASNGEHGVYHYGSTNTSYADCKFINNAKIGVCYYSSGGVLNFQRCVFIGNQQGGFNIAAEEDASANIEINECVFRNNNATTGAGIYIGTEWIGLTCHNTTFVSNSSGLGSAIHIAQHDYSMTLEDCIIAYNSGGVPIWCDAVSGDIIMCTDIYGNVGGDWVGCIAGYQGLNGNISLNPLFCNPDSGIYTIYNSSPCAPANNSCGALIGALGVACGPYLGSIGIEDGDILHVKSSTPPIYWAYRDLGAVPQDSFQVQVGIDTLWDIAEMWNPAPVASADTFVTYAGAPLVDGATYYLRLRVHNGVVWSNWYQTLFRMNSVPSVPVLASPDSGAIVNTATPTLYVHNSTDPENDTLTYDFYIDHHSMWGPPSPIEDSNIVQGNDSTGWTVTPPLNENWRYVWRARSFDGYEYSAWTPLKEFYVNAIEESPWPFALIRPPDTAGNIVFNMLPYFFWGICIDPDPQDHITYTLYIAIDSNFQYVHTIEIPENQYTPTDSLFFGTKYWWKVKATDETGRFTYSTDIHNFRTWKLGDANGDWLVNIQDITFLINFLYKGGTAPNPVYVGDLNGTCLVNIQDITYLINYLYKDGPAPKIGCM